MKTLRRELAAWRNQHRAGRRARRKYAQLRRAWLRRTRSRFLTLGAVSAAVWAVLVVFLSGLPGDASWATWLSAGLVVGMLVASRWSPPVHVATWEYGAFGEQETAKQLRRLERKGWVVLHDLANGVAHFDHVVIGPPGVFCLNSKWSGYDLHVADDGRLVGRHRYDPDLTVDVTKHLRAARREAIALSAKILERCGEKVWVNPVVVWWGSVERGGKLHDGVGVVQGDLLAERLERQQGRPVRDLDALLEVLRPGRHARRRGAWLRPAVRAR